MKKVDFTVIKIDDSHICYMVQFFDGEDSMQDSYVFDDYPKAYSFFQRYLKKELDNEKFQSI